MKKWQEEFIDSFMSSKGFGDIPPSSLRVLGWLIISDTSEHSAEDLQHELQISSGGLSSALNTLYFMGLIEKRVTPGSRKLLYKVSSQAAVRIFDTQIEHAERIADVSEKALKHSPNNRHLLDTNKTATKWLGLVRKVKKDTK